MSVESQSMMHDIVVVDDDELTLELVRRTLRDTTLDLVFLNNEERALQYLQVHNTHLLLVDQRMPRLSGVELLRELSSCERLDDTTAFLCSAETLPPHIVALASQISVTPLLKDVYRDKSRMLALVASSKESDKRSAQY